MPDPIQSFPPLADPDARVLILGSMPGEESLRKSQYYAHPRNQFWTIMGELFGAGRDLPYTARLERLRTRRIALWDVVHRCRREGSLDSSIESDSVEPNDFVGLFDRCPGIETVYFNGKKAEDLFRRTVYPQMGDTLDGIAQHALPSTSPAHASLNVAQKLECWRAVKG